jgi:hypothetical protein
VNYPWWAEEISPCVPLFRNFEWVTPFDMNNPNWYCAREQLWAMREGLA